MLPRLEDGYTEGRGDERGRSDIGGEHGGREPDGGGYGVPGGLSRWTLMPWRAASWPAT
jgi:hypothetical protein